MSGSRVICEKIDVAERPQCAVGKAGSCLRSLHQDERAVVGGSDAPQKDRDAEGLDRRDAFVDEQLVGYRAPVLTPGTSRDELETVVSERVDALRRRHDLAPRAPK